jgi:hypothetical protein
MVYFFFPFFGASFHFRELQNGQATGFDTRGNHLFPHLLHFSFLEKYCMDKPPFDCTVNHHYDDVKHYFYLFLIVLRYWMVKQ